MCVLINLFRLRGLKSIFSNKLEQFWIAGWVQLFENYTNFQDSISLEDLYYKEKSVNYSTSLIPNNLPNYK